MNDLCADAQLNVRHLRWVDAALATAGIWQAADDALASVTSPLTVAAGRARRRGDRAGRGASVVLDGAQGLLAAPRRPAPAARRHAERWRAAVLALAVETAGLAVDPPADGAADPRIERAARLVGVVGDVPAQVGGAVTRLPSCFRSFDQHPDDVAALVDRFAARWPDRSRPVVVVGVRTSGSYLAPFAVQALRRAGFADVGMVSARPDHRYLPADARTLRTAADDGASVLVIDDPPESGSAVARVCAGLADDGFPPSAIIPALALFDESPHPPAALSAFESVTLPWSEWSIHRRLAPDQVARALAAVHAPATVRITGEVPAPPSLPRTHARRLFRVEVTSGAGQVETCTVLAVGSGLGYFGEHDVAVSCALKGHVPTVLGRADGVLLLDWPDDARPVQPSPAEVVGYVRARHDSLAVDDDPSDRLRGCQPVWEVASNHLARVYGQFWPLARLAFADRLTRRMLHTAAPSVPDGDMRPAAWLAGGDRPVKTSFAERTFSNFDLVCFDDRFDVVGAAVHTGDAGYARELRTAYEAPAGRRISPERWLLYELVHLWDLQRLGGASPAAAGARKSQAMREYLADVLLRGAEAPADGPLVALDVDGVLETDLLGYKAPTPTGVLSLRALHAHGFRTVLATGRSLDDVVAMSEVFGLAGGTAEYGSVAYDRRTASVTPLVDDDELAALDLLRESLQGQPSVRVDDRHRFSVRASSVDERGRLGALERGPVPAGLRAIVGEEQTDVVTARLDKADGVHALVGLLGGEPPLLAVGDTASDVGLLGAARTSVVPRHADAAAKAAATRVARRPYQGGLAEAVGGLIGHRPGNCPRCAAPDMTAETRTMLQLLRVPEGSRLQALARSVPLLRTDLRRSPSR
ncbi:MAG TPA: hypothetical protein VGN28_13405 [Blastococcus sp.]|nr:hypothetical protein [Blastococcus sp.]